MSIRAAHLEILHRAGRTIDEAITVAEAMERGDDYRSGAGIIEAMQNTGATPEQIAAVITVWARETIERNLRQPFQRDEHSKARDSNKARRNLSNEAWRELRATVLERDGHECQYCGSLDDLTCDHILPLVRGGTNELDNLTTACRPCNSSKGGKTLTEWQGRYQ